MSHELFIKNMVCNRCVMAVDGLLRENGFHPVSVELGHAVVEAFRIISPASFTAVTAH